MSTREETNPWQTLTDKKVYENNWITLTEYDVINPSGGKGIYGKVHFKNLAIGIVPLDEENNTWLIGQYRYPINKYSWEIPEGGGLVGTDPLTAAKRELLEEAGLVAREWKQLMHFHLSNSVCDEEGYIFVARQLEQRMAAPEETEQLVIRKLPFEEAFQMVQQGIITDAITIMAIQQVKLLQQ